MSEWISVKDGLPKFTQEPYGASDDVIWAVIINNKILRWGKGNLGTDGEWYKACIPLADIPTHWMPLPEAPNV